MITSDAATHREDMLYIGGYLVAVAESVYLRRTVGKLRKERNKTRPTRPWHTISHLPQQELFKNPCLTAGANKKPSQSPPPALCLRRGMLTRELVFLILKQIDTPR